MHLLNNCQGDGAICSQMAPNHMFSLCAPILKDSLVITKHGEASKYNNKERKRRFPGCPGLAGGVPFFLTTLTLKNAHITLANILFCFDELREHS